MRYDSCGGSVNKQAWIVRKLRLFISFFAKDNHRVRLLAVDVGGKRTGLHTAVRKIIPAFVALETEQEERKPFARDKGYGGAKQGHHNAGGHQ